MLTGRRAMPRARVLVLVGAVIVVLVAVGVARAVTASRSAWSIHTTDCSSSARTGFASGVVENHAARPHSFAVVVRWVNADFEVVGEATGNVDVVAHGEGGFRLSGALSGSSRGCQEAHASLVR
jgi:hypothetical protein